MDWIMYVVTYVKRCISNLRYNQEDVIAGTICSELILVRDGHYQNLLTRSECIDLIEMLCTDCCFFFSCFLFFLVLIKIMLYICIHILL